MADQAHRRDQPGSTALAIAAGNVVRADNNLPGTPNSGTLLAVSVDYVNANSTTVEGFDFDINQRVGLGRFGKLGLDLQWTRVSSFERVEPEGTRFEYAGTHGNCEATNCIGTPKDKVNFGATWDVGSFSMSWIVNYIGSFRNVAFEGGCLRQVLR